MRYCVTALLRCDYRDEPFRRATAAPIPMSPMTIRTSAEPSVPPVCGSGGTGVTGVTGGTGGVGGVGGVGGTGGVGAACVATSSVANVPFTSSDRLSSVLFADANDNALAIIMNGCGAGAAAAGTTKRTFA